MKVALRNQYTTHAPRAVVLIRILAGSVFLFEGIQKFLFPAEVGVGRLEKIGIPQPDLLAPFVGGCEILGGMLLLLGLLTRPAYGLLLCIMFVAIASTKIPVFVRDGFWKMAHEARTDWSMIVSLIFLIIVGAGPRSLDAKLVRILHARLMFGLASAWMHFQIPKRSVGIWSLQFVWARWVPHKLQAITKQARDGLFPNIFHGERSKFSEKYGLTPRGDRMGLHAGRPTDRRPPQHRSQKLEDT
jgi:putative oxidoreductase